MQGLSPVVASGGHSSSRCAGLSPSRPLLLRSTGSRRAGSAIVAHGPSCSAACGIFPDQGSNPCPLPWQADSQPLRHQGSPSSVFLCTCALTQHCHTHPGPKPSEGPPGNGDTLHFVVIFHSGGMFPYHFSHSRTCRICRGVFSLLNFESVP